MSELKRCQCCKAEAKIIAGSVFMWEQAVACSECGLSTKMYHGISPSEARNKAIEAWNTRKPIKRILERLEEETNNSINDFDRTRDYYHDGKADGFERAIKIVREEGGLNNG